MELKFKRRIQTPLILGALSMLIIAMCYAVVSNVLDRDIRIATKSSKSLVGKSKASVTAELGKPTVSVQYPIQFQKEVKRLSPHYGVIRDRPGAATVDIYDRNPACIVVFYSKLGTVSHVDVYGS